MTYVTRSIEHKIISYIESDSNEVLLLAGARQTGKTTLVENVEFSKPKLIINLWDEQREIIALRESKTFDEFERVLKTVFGFEPDGSRILIIDEAQASESICKFIMEMHRTWIKQKVILLGSLLANLYQRGMPMPVGRTVEIIVRPLNFREFLRFSKKENYLEYINDIENIPETIHTLILDEFRVFMQIGGLPGIVNAYRMKQDLIMYFESILNNLYRDADRFIHPEKDKIGRHAQYGRIVETVMREVAAHICSPTQNSTLLSTDSPAYRTILPLVLEALNSWHLLYSIRSQAAQLSTKGYSSKKYLYDTGIANFLLTRLMPVQFGKGDQVSAMLLENAVLQECVSYSGSIQAIQSYKSSNKIATELDFAVIKDAARIPLEVKSSLSVKTQTLYQMLDYMNRFAVENGYVVYTGRYKKEILHGKNIYFIPPYFIGQLLEKTL